MGILDNNPVIAASRKAEDYSRAIDCPSQILFLLSSNLTTLQGQIEAAKAAGKYLFVHMDFCGGLSSDRNGLEYLKSLGVYGVITTKSNLIAAAREQGIKTVQRFFIIDSWSVGTMLDTLRHTRPDMIEIMPGIMPDIIRKISSAVRIPTIAGGLVSTKHQVLEALKAGAKAVSTAEEQLWYE